MGDFAAETCGPRAGVALTMDQAQTLLDHHLPGRRCLAIRYIDRGYNNRTYEVRLDTEPGSKIVEPDVQTSQIVGSEIILRLGGCFWTKRKTENEVACLVYLRHHRPWVPVPRVLFYGSTGSLIGAEYIAMELLPGRPLDEAWPEMTDVQRLTAVGNLAHLLAEIRSLTFDRIGNLAFNRVPGQVVPTADDVFVDQCFEVGDGPFSDYGAFEKAFFQDSMDEFMTHPLYRPLRRHLAPRLRRFYHSFFEEDRGAMDDLTDIVMTHYDLEPRNVLVDTDGGVTGLLDWEFAGAFPADVEWFSSLEFLDANSAEKLLGEYVDAMDRAGEDALSRVGCGTMSCIDNAKNSLDDAMGRAGEDALSGVGCGTMSCIDNSKNSLDDAMGRAGEDALSGVGCGTMSCIDNSKNTVDEAMGRAGEDALSRVSCSTMSCIDNAMGRSSEDALSGVCCGTMSCIDNAKNSLDDAMGCSGEDALRGVGCCTMSCIDNAKNSLDDTMGRAGEDALRGNGCGTMSCIDNTKNCLDDAMGRASEDALSGVGCGTMSCIDNSKNSLDDAMGRASEDASSGVGCGTMSCIDNSKNSLDDAMGRASEDARSGVDCGTMSCIDNSKNSLDDAMGRASEDALSGVGCGTMSCIDNANNSLDDAMGRASEDALSGVGCGTMSCIDNAKNSLDDAMSLTGNGVLSGAGEDTMCVQCSAVDCTMNSGIKTQQQKETSRYRTHFMGILKSHGIALPPETYKERHLRRTDFWVLRDSIAPWYLTQVGEDPPPEAIAQRTQAAAIVDLILQKYGF